MDNMMQICMRLRFPYALRSSHFRVRYGTRPKGNVPRKGSRRKILAQVLEEDDAESDIEGFSHETYQEFERLESELQQDADVNDDPVAHEDSPSDDLQPVPKPAFPEYRIRHQFVGFDPRYMDLEDFPRLRTDFDGKKGEYQWMGTECTKCGMQVRRERRTNRETSLNVYANPQIPDELLRHCPERKMYPVLWRTRDPYVALDVLAVEDY